MAKQSNDFLLACSSEHCGTAAVHPSEGLQIMCCKAILLLKDEP